MEKFDFFGTIVNGLEYDKFNGEYRIEDNNFHIETLIKTQFLLDLENGNIKNFYYYVLSHNLDYFIEAYIYNRAEILYLLNTKYKNTLLRTLILNLFDYFDALRTYKFCFENVNLIGNFVAGNVLPEYFYNLVDKLNQKCGLDFDYNVDNIEQFVYQNLHSINELLNFYGYTPTNDPVHDILSLIAKEYNVLDASKQLTNLLKYTHDTIADTINLTFENKKNLKEIVNNLKTNTNNPLEIDNEIFDNAKKNNKNIDKILVPDVPKEKILQKIEEVETNKKKGKTPVTNVTNVTNTNTIVNNVVENNINKPNTINVKDVPLIIGNKITTSLSTESNGNIETPNPVINNNTVNNTNTNNTIEVSDVPLIIGNKIGVNIPNSSNGNIETNNPSGGDVGSIVNPITTDSQGNINTENVEIINPKTYLDIYIFTEPNLKVLLVSKNYDYVSFEINDITDGNFNNIIYGKYMKDINYKGYNYHYNINLDIIDEISINKNDIESDINVINLLMSYEINNGILCALNFKKDNNILKINFSTENEILDLEYNNGNTIEKYSNYDSYITDIIFTKEDIIFNNGEKYIIFRFGEDLDGSGDFFESHQLTFKPIEYEYDLRTNIGNNSGVNNIYYNNGYFYVHNINSINYYKISENLDVTKITKEEYQNNTKHKIKYDIDTKIEFYKSKPTLIPVSSETRKINFYDGNNTFLQILDKSIPNISEVKNTENNLTSLALILNENKTDVEDTIFINKNTIYGIKDYISASINKQFLNIINYENNFTSLNILGENTIKEISYIKDEYIEYDKNNYINCANNGNILDYSTKNKNDEFTIFCNYNNTDINNIFIPYKGKFLKLSSTNTEMVDDLPLNVNPITFSKDDFKNSLIYIKFFPYVSTEEVEEEEETNLIEITQTPLTNDSVQIIQSTENVDTIKKLIKELNEEKHKLIILNEVAKQIVKNNDKIVNNITNQTAFDKCDGSLILKNINTKNITDFNNNLLTEDNFTFDDFTIPSKNQLKYIVAKKKYDANPSANTLIELKKSINNIIKNKNYNQASVIQKTNDTSLNIIKLQKKLELSLNTPLMPIDTTLPLFKQAKNTLDSMQDNINIISTSFSNLQLQYNIVLGVNLDVPFLDTLHKTLNKLNNNINSLFCKLKAGLCDLGTILFIVNGIIEGFNDIVNSSSGSSGGSTLDNIENAISSISTDVDNAVTGITNSIKGAADFIKAGIQNDLTDNTLDEIESALEEAGINNEIIDKLMDEFKKIANDCNSLSDMADNLMNNALEGVKQLGDDFKNDVANSVKNFIGSCALSSNTSLDIGLPSLDINIVIPKIGLGDLIDELC